MRCALLWANSLKTEIMHDITLDLLVSLASFATFLGFVFFIDITLYRVRMGML